MSDNKTFATIKNNPKFVLFYRLAAFFLITAGMFASLQLLEEEKNLYALFTYTLQSNLFVWVFFLVNIIQTLRKVVSKKHDNDFGFTPVFSFAVCIAIVVTFLIFWCYLVPTGWAKNSLLTFRNLSIHLFCPLFMVLDRVLFYKKATFSKKQILYILIFPLVYLAQSLSLGLTHTVWFGSIGVDGYYIYPFLDVDAFGALVILFVIALAGLFLGLSFLWYHLEKRSTKPL